MSRTLELPKQRHLNCEHDRCPICFEDAQHLTDYLFERTGLSRRFHDMLGEYRGWLDKNAIPSESKFGWPLPSVYAPENIEAFIKQAIGDES